jgi:hypothetical protein
MNKNLIWLFVIVVIAFITVGDSFEFIPQPVQDASLQSRKFVVGLWPDWLRPKDTNERTEEAVEELEKGKKKE